MATNAWRRAHLVVRNAVRREWVWVPMLMSAVVLMLYREVWWGVDGKLLWFGWDVPESYWPDLAHFAGSLHEGDWPLWNPYDRGGYAFAADTVYGMYYPVTWLLVVPGALAGDIPAWVGQAKQLLHWAMGATFMYAYLRTRRLPRIACVSGGVMWIVSVPMMIHKASALNFPLVWAPVVWIATDRLIERAGQPRIWVRAAALAASLGVAGASGPPPGFFYLLIASLVYGVFRVSVALWDAHGQARLGREACGQAIGVAIAGVATLCLLAIVVVPGLEVAADSFTRGATRNAQYAMHTALPVTPTLKALFYPPAGHFDSYLGLLPLILALFVLVARPRVDRGAPVVFACIAVFATLLSFGGNTPVLGWCVEHLPVFGLFREPNRYKCVAAMCIAVAAAHGLALLLQADVARRRRWIAIGIGLGVMIVAVVSLRGVTPAIPKHLKNVTFLTTVFVLVSATLLLVVAACHFRPRITTIACVGVIFVHYWDSASFGLRWIRVTEAPTDHREDLKYISGLDDVRQRWRIYDEFVMEQRPGSRLRLRNFRGYPSLDPFADMRYVDALKKLRTNPELLAAFNVRYVFHGPHHRSGKRANFVRSAQHIVNSGRFRRIDSKRYETTDPAPLAQWYGSVQVVRDKAAAMTALVAQESAVGQRQRAIVEQADVPAEMLPKLQELVGHPEPVPGTLVSFATNRVAVQIRAPRAGLLVVNEKMAPGWSVTVDGRSATPIRANYLLRGVYVTEGQHDIVWSYWPRHYSWLLLLWLGTNGFLIVAVFVAVRDKRRARLLGNSQPIE